MLQAPKLIKTSQIASNFPHIWTKFTAISTRLRKLKKKEKKVEKNSFIQSKEKEEQLRLFSLKGNASRRFWNRNHWKLQLPDPASVSGIPLKRTSKLSFEIFTNYSTSRCFLQRIEIFLKKIVSGQQKKMGKLFLQISDFYFFVSQSESCILSRRRYKIQFSWPTHE